MSERVALASAVQYGSSAFTIKSEKRVGILPGCVKLGSPCEYSETVQE